MIINNIFKARWIHCILFFVMGYCSICRADEGYKLWLRYEKVQDNKLFYSYRQMLQSVQIQGSSPTMDVAGQELERGLEGLLDQKPIIHRSKRDDFVATTILTTATELPSKQQKMFKKELAGLKENGFLIKHNRDKDKSHLFVIGKDDLGVLYGIFHLLRLMQTHSDIGRIDEVHNPKLRWRMLNHWDNLNGTVERGYAGLSIWQWDDLPHQIEDRYTDYARANASIGINGVAINNVNASPQILTSEYIEKVEALANVFRPYGIRIFISVNFASPRVIGSLKTADPLDPGVQDWWKEKAEEIYQRIPDFGGFLVKANSEGQPGPQDYGRTHVDGANMLAKAVAPHNGIVIWRAFVYEARNQDRVKDPYDEFFHFDGQFLPNVMVQTKNGPLDFQPREPISPLFGALPNTSQMMEFQITQEYLGFSTHLVYMASLYKEVLATDTYARGEGSLVAKVLDGSLQGQPLTGMAGVSNIGDVSNWTGHPFGQANWYAYGRLAWDHSLSAEQLAREWIQMTLTQDKKALGVIENIMLSSYEHVVNYMTPLGLTVLSSLGHHYGPQPWARTRFHRADQVGAGFDRTSKGSKAVEQYFSPLRDSFDNIDSCPEHLIAWFHHVPWNRIMQSGRSFWEELCFHYYDGVEGVRKMQQNWTMVKDAVSAETYAKVVYLLEVQEDEAVWWRDACLWYFGQFSRLAIPKEYEKPRYDEAEFKRRGVKSRGMKPYSITSP